jgi:hypothetical protein
MPWNICDTKMPQKEKQYLLKFPPIHDKSQFQSNCNTTHLDTKKVVNEKVCLSLSSYAHSRSQFQNIYNYTNLHNLLTHETKEI